MVKLRETLASGGIATLAVVFALAFAAYYLVIATAQVAVNVLGQQISSRNEFPFDLHIFGSDIQYEGILDGALTVVLVVLALYGVWRFTRGSVRICPECHSEIPRQASVCRYCTSELPEAP